VVDAGVAAAGTPADAVEGVGATATTDGVEADPDDDARGAFVEEAAGVADLPAVAVATGAVVTLVVVVGVVVAAGAVDAVAAATV
jgi:hypothetical protein